MTGDPASGDVIAFIDASIHEIGSYHVEFLGHPHTHGWVQANHMSIFTAPEAAKDLQLQGSIKVFMY